MISRVLFVKVLLHTWWAGCPARPWITDEKDRYAHTCGHVCGMSRVWCCALEVCTGMQLHAWHVCT